MPSVFQTILFVIFLYSWGRISHLYVPIKCSLTWEQTTYQENTGRLAQVLNKCVLGEWMVGSSLKSQGITCICPQPVPKASIRQPLGKISPHFGPLSEHKGDHPLRRPLFRHPVQLASPFSIENVSVWTKNYIWSPWRQGCFGLFYSLMWMSRIAPSG